MSVYVTGDIHGSLSRMEAISEFCKENHTTAADDVLICLGDVGFNYYGGSADWLIKRKAAEIPITFVCIQGNHENRPQNIPSYSEVRAFGSKAMLECMFPNIIFLIDGEEYTIDGKTFLALGGAYSVDKYYRLANGHNWYPDEQIPLEKRNEILERIRGKSFNYVLSHTCPFEWQPFDLFLPGIDQSTVDNSQEHWLTDVKNSLASYDRWLYGHFHSDRVQSEEENAWMLFSSIIKLY